MDYEYGRLYRDLYQRHWWWRSREEAVVQFLRKHLNSKSGRAILDVGCGDGLFFDRLAEFGDVYGVEPDERLIDKNGPHAARICIAPFDENFRSDKPYDLLVMLDVLEHLEDPEGALACANRLLKPEGTFLLTVPAFQTLWTNHDVINHHRLRYRRRTLFPLIQKAGFRVAATKYWFQWTVPAKFVIASFQKLFPSEPKLPKVPPQWLNKILYSLSRLEQKTLGATGIPVGSTLMVYCKKS